MFLRLYILLLIVLFTTVKAFPQLDTKYYFGATYLKQDSVPLVMFNPVIIFADRIFKNKTEANNYYRLVRNVKKVYPLARICQIKIDEYDEKLQALTSERDKKVLLKKAEKELKEEFTPVIKDLTYTQGKILLKLIDRQTGSSSFNLIKEYRGAIQAVFWQFFAKIFGNDLKMKYDPFGDDKTIESIVQLIELGLI